MPRRDRTHWTDREHHDLAHIFVKNGSVVLSPEHPDVVEFASLWERTPTAVENVLWRYASNDPGYHTSHVAFGVRVARALVTTDTRA